MRMLARSLATAVWGHWLPVTLLWLFCAVWVVVLVKHAEHKETLSGFGSGIVSTLLLLPFAMRHSWGVMRRSLRVLLAIGLLAALERNLTNESLASIGASLKTALHAFNVPLTFLVAAAAGVDKQSHRCLFKGECSANGLALLPVLLLVTGGAVVTAAFSQGKTGRWSGGALGIALQLGSGLAYATKYTVTKRVLGDAPSAGASRLDSALLPDGSLPSVPPPMAGPAAGDEGASATRPAKVQVALISQLLTGAVSFAFLPLFGKSWGVPPLATLLYFGFAVTGILIFELRLLELTSPLTVAVLSALHNVAIVLYFVLFDGEDFAWPQRAGFAVSTVGVMGYAMLKHRQQTQQPESAAAASA